LSRRGNVDVASMIVARVAENNALSRVLTGMACGRTRRMKNLN
jgi:hypothetical protein